MMRFELENEEGLRLRGLAYGATPPPSPCRWRRAAGGAAGLRRRGLPSPSRYGWGLWRGALPTASAAPALSGKASAGRWTPTRGQLPARRARRVPSPHLADQGAGGGQGQAGAPLPGGDQGFPGNLRVSLEYRLEQCDLVVDFCASTDAPSPVSLTSHAYFNLDGGGDIRHHTISLDADRYLPTDDQSLPLAIAPVEGPFDLRAPAPSARRGWTTPAAVGQGYDHAFLLNNSDFEPADEPFGGSNQPWAARVISGMASWRWRSTPTSPPCSSTAATG